MPQGTSTPQALSKAGFHVWGKQMYRLHRLGSLSNPDHFWLDYEWDDSFENTEWRPCVEHFVQAIAARGHEVVAIPPPPFERGEDFIEVVYLLDGVRTTFTSDLLLSLIEIKTEDPRVLRDVWGSIGDEVGWVPSTAPSKPSRKYSASAFWRRIRR